MLQTTNLHVSIEDKNDSHQTILHDVSLTFKQGKNYCILGKNGSGKSSLALTIMGHPGYVITQGDILLNNTSIRDMEPNERAKAGIFLAFQSIPDVPGVKLFEFLRTIYNATHDTQETFISFKKIILPLLDTLGIDKEFLWRDLNVGFSGGERRKIEILQLTLLSPRYIFLDEVDSGLDVDAFKAVASLLRHANTPSNTFIVITHYFGILDYIDVDTVYVMEQGQLTHTGDEALARRIQTQGFGSL